MDLTQKDVLETAELLNIHVDEKDIDSLTQSFVTLIEYFEVLNNVPLDEEIIDVSDDTYRFRNGNSEPKQNTESLIENSEEHEDNYVLIPNIL